MKLIKIGNRYINPEKVTVVYEFVNDFGDKSTIVSVGRGEQEYAMTEDNIESVVKKITQEGGVK